MCKCASDVLKKYNLDDNIPINLDKLIEELNINVRVRDFSEIEDVENQIAGYIKKTKNGQATILVNVNDIPTRQRFTIAHEIGHYFLHMKDNSEESHIELRTVAKDSKELSADRFAAELLMPENLIRKEHDKLMFATATELAQKFNVSFSAMKYRLDTLGLWHYD